MNKKIILLVHEFPFLLDYETLNVLFPGGMISELLANVITGDSNIIKF